jgi:GT2 family glycosyltransferase
VAWASAIAQRPVRAAATTTQPDVSIVIPVYNQAPFTLACIEALLQHESRYSFEILVGDDSSTDATAAALAVPLPAVRHIRHEVNLGFVRNCNATAREAGGRYVVFLNNDTQVLPRWLDELIGTLEANPSIGLAGSKLVYPDGRLQECGGIVWRDGSAWNYGRLGDPRRPEFSYMRDVDYVSGASIALSTSLWRELDGFDELFVPAYAEDADLAFRVRHRGLRTVVQPLSQLLHFEGISSGTDLGTGAKAYQVDNLRKLHARWADVLEGHRANADQPELEKERGVRHRTLFVDHCTPSPNEDAGSLVAFEIMQAFIANGHKVTFVPEDNFAHMGARTRDLQRLGIEAIYHPAYSRMSSFIGARQDPYDVIFLHRFGVADAHMAALRRAYPGSRIVFLNADLHYLRQMRQAELDHDDKALANAHAVRAKELRVVAAADVALVHSDHEQVLLQRELPEANVVLFPLIHDPAQQVHGLASREGVCFVGGFQHPPNADGIRWFVDAVWPLVLAARPDEQLYIVGSNVTSDVEALANIRGVNVTGFVEDLDAFLDRRRVSVAPLRYGAGAKGKVAGSLARGLPTVCTPVAAEGMGLEPGVDVLVGDTPEALARHLLALLESDGRWEQLSRNALLYAANTTSRVRAHQRIRELIQGVAPGR